MFEQLQVLAWATTYVLIILAGYKCICSNEKAVSMPYIAGVMNFAWEICALEYSSGLYGHVMWLGLDLVIFYVNFIIINSRKNQILYIFFTVLATVFLFVMFKLPQGMLFSVFIIDVIMSIVFIISIKKISPFFKISIGILKLIGDVFAGLQYYQESVFVAGIAIIVFVCNSIYLYRCIKEKSVLR